MKIKRVRRGCYDKFHRCPGWAGGGWKYPRPEDVVCPSGSLPNAFERKWWFKFHDKCGTLVLPFWSRWLDPAWWRYVVSEQWPRQIRDRRELRQVLVARKRRDHNI